ALRILKCSPRIASGSSSFPPRDRHCNADEDRLPRVEPGDIPTADTSDFAFGSLTPVLAALLPEWPARREALNRDLRSAGYYEPHALVNLAAVRYVAIILPLLVMGTLLVLVPPSLEGAVLVGLISLPIIGWAFPRLYIRGRARD